MAFAGDLQKFPLADVFQSCHQNRLTGALAIRDARGERLIAFEEGMVTGCAGLDEGDETLAGELVRRRLVSPDAIGRPSRFFKRKGSLKRSLTRRNVLNSSEFNSFTRSVVLERIYDCFLLEEGNFEFVEDYDKTRFDDDEEAAKVRINPNEILMEAMRRIDEWTRIRRSIPSFREVYVATREPTEEDSELVREILTLTSSGTLSLEEVMQKAPAARFESCETIMSLVEAGDVRVATVPEYIELGKKAEAAGDLEAAASFYARGLSYERGNVDLNQRRIAVLEKLGRKSEAADERKLFAGTLLEQGKKAEAAEQYRKAAELVDADPLPLERLLDLKLKEKDFAGAKDAAERLVALYLRLGLGDSAKKVYPRLLMLEPKDRWVRERLAATHVELHEAATAAGIYKELGQEALEEGDAAAALAHLQRALELQPDDKKLSALVRDLESGELAARRRRRRVFLSFSIALLLLGATTAWVVYEAMALFHLRELAADSVKLDGGCEVLLIGINTLQPGPEELGDGRRRLYRGTFASRWARETAVKLAGLYAREAAHAGLLFRLPPPPGEPLPRDEVLRRLDAALHPPQEQSLGALVEVAEKELAEGKRAEATATLREVGRRLEEARLALSQSDGPTRAYTVFRERLAEVRGLLPRIEFARGLAEIELPEARAVVEAAAARWRTEQAERAAAEGTPANGAGS